MSCRRSNRAHLDYAEQGKIYITKDQYRNGRNLKMLILIKETYRTFLK